MQLTQELIQLMFDIAIKNPIQAGEVMPSCCVQENVSFEGHDLNIVLTHELIDNNIHIWHFSVANLDQTLVPVNVSNQVVKQFFEAPFKELPKYMFPPDMRFMDQYVKIVDGCNCGK